MVIFKETPKGTKEAIQVALGIVDGLIETFPGGSIEYDTTGAVVSVWFTKVWKIDSARVTLKAAVRVTDKDG